MHRFTFLQSEISSSRLLVRSFARCFKGTPYKRNSRILLKHLIVWLAENALISTTCSTFCVSSTHLLLSILMLDTYSFEVCLYEYACQLVGYTNATLIKVTGRTYAARRVLDTLCGALICLSSSHSIQKRGLGVL
jgi:hypothetical protein